MKVINNLLRFTQRKLKIESIRFGKSRVLMCYLLGVIVLKTAPFEQRQVKLDFGDKNYCKSIS